MPAGCLNIISCKPQDAAQVVNAMIEHPAVRKVNFTGSTAVGRHIAVACAKVLKPCLMELGGKNSAIICEDANFDVAIPGVIAGFSLNVSADSFLMYLTKHEQSGQICMSTDRILIHASIAEKFVAALKAALSGSDTSASPSTLVTSASKVRVEKVVAAAISSGAHFIHGEEQSSEGMQKVNGVRVAPVILGGVTEDMDIWQNEAFAPLAACMVVKDDDEAIRVANKGGYGLSASIFTEDLRKGLALAKGLESG